MLQQQQAFYQSNFSKLITDIGNVQDPSIQEMHNLAICKYLQAGVSPIAELEKLIVMIKNDSQSSNSSSMSSYFLISYHLALAYTDFCQFAECEKLLNELWMNIEKADKLVFFFISLLTVELFIRNGQSPLLEQAVQYLNSNFPNSDSVHSLLSSKNIDSGYLLRVLEYYSNYQFRIEVQKAQFSNNENECKHIVQKYFPLALDKSSPKLRIFKSMQLSSLAIKLKDYELLKSIIECSDDQNHCSLLNNVGLMELVSGRYTMALLYFSRALNSQYFHQYVYPYHQIVYHIGLSSLMKGKAKSAFHHLSSIIPLMERSPFLWLRLSECFVKYFQNRIRKLREKSQYSPIIRDKFSTDNRTYYVIPLSDYQVFCLDNEKDPLITMSYAERCAKNCIALCSETQKDIKRKAELLCAYIYIIQNDGYKANEACKSLMSDNFADKQQQFLSRIYASQSSFMIGDYEETKILLARMMIENTHLKDKCMASTHNLTSARYFMEIGDYRKAEQHLSKVLDNDPHHPQAVLTRIALEIQRGFINEAVSYMNSHPLSNVVKNE